MNETVTHGLDLDPVARLTRDILTATRTLTPDEARYLVTSYYAIQDYRKASGNQVRALTGTEEPCSTLEWLYKQMDTLENQIKRALAAWSDETDTGKWAQSITGIGPVISAGLLAHIDIAKAPTVGHIWRFAGLDPTQVWEKKQKRPWNASLKVLCWKIGESFVKFSNHPKDHYGRVYAGRKEWEAARNEQGLYADQARGMLEKKKIESKDARACYEAGKLPPGHLHARAKRYATKLFLSHYQLVAWFCANEALPPLPYAVAHLDHAHLILPPNTDLIAGLDEALRKAGRT